MYVCLSGLWLGELHVLHLSFLSAFLKLVCYVQCHVFPCIYIVCPNFLSALVCGVVDMTIEDVRKYEQQLRDETNKKVLEGLDLPVEDSNSDT